MPYNVNGVMTRGTLFTTKASAAETTSSTHGSYDGGSAAVAVVQVAVTAVSGTTPTLLVTVQGSLDNSTWVTIGQVGSNGFSFGDDSAPANITTTGTYTGVFPAFQFIRTTSTVGGTTPSFTYSVVSQGNIG